MASTYYDSAGKSVVAGDIAYAADINDINNAVDSAFQQVEVAISAISSGQSYYSDLAEAWAINPEDSEVEPGNYSALHWATKAHTDATQVAADRVQTGLDRASCTSSANTASGAASTATTRADTATGAANTATVQAGIATDQADLAIAAAAIFKPTPVGSIVAFNGGYYTNASNGGFTNVVGNTVAAVNAYCNSDGWYACDGSTLNLAGSPIFNGTGRYLPNLTDSRFIQGSTTAGSVGGSNTTSHTHTITHTHTISHNHNIYHSHGTGNFTLTINEIPSHRHPFSSFDINGNTSLGTEDAGSPITQYTSYVGGSQAHNHGSTVSQDTTTTGPPSATNSGASSAANTGTPSNTENRPSFLSCIYIMRAI
jgi:hypothetical protein